MNIIENGILLSKDELTKMLRDSYLAGANSHDHWSGQYDTCWTNVHIDCSEYIKSKNKEIFE